MKQNVKSIFLGFFQYKVSNQSTIFLLLVREKTSKKLVIIQIDFQEKAMPEG